MFPRNDHFGIGHTWAPHKVQLVKIFLCGHPKWAVIHKFELRKGTPKRGGTSPIWINAMPATHLTHDAMSADVSHSITDWLLEAAVKGKQRHFYIENPTKSMLWDRPYMSDFLGLSGLTPQRCNYYCYQIMLANPLV